MVIDHFFKAPSMFWIIFCISVHTLHAEKPAIHVERIGEINFTILDGYRLDLVAGERLTTWPMLADWDRDGNMLVVESAGVTRPIEEHNKQQTHRIIRLSDLDDDGIFDTRTVVANNLPFTEGVLCLGDDLLACSPPNIYRLMDQDADGICEAREVWFDGQTITGCANDLHGPYFGRDGWIYWCKGAFAEQAHSLIGGGQLTTKASHIFRRRLTGGPIESVMTGGMDNPVECAITPEGERFFTSTFLQHPSNGLRDGIVHAVYGGVYGKPHPVIDGHARTGPLMPIMVQLGAAAPSGLICLESSDLLASEPQQSTLVSTLYNLQKVTAHRLQPSGASFRSENLDLVVADRVDFHPTDVLEDADGSLLIVDTGGWYDLCCPTSRVDQKTAAGGIYRLTKLGVRSAEKTLPNQHPKTINLNKLSAKQLSDCLIDVKPWVAREAKIHLQALSEPAANSLIGELGWRLSKPELPVADRLAYLWGLAAIGSEQSLSVVNDALLYDEASLAQAACHANSVNRFTAARINLETLVASSRSLAVRRAAAEALGRLGNESSARVLLQSLAMETTDRHWQHSVIFALIELRATSVAVEFLAAESSLWQRIAATIVLDQLNAPERLTTEVMLSLLESTNPDARNAAAEILAKHPEWSISYKSSIDGLFHQPDGKGAGLVEIVAGWKGTDTMKQLLADWLDGASDLSDIAQLRLLNLLDLYANQPIDLRWEHPLAKWLTDADESRRSQLASTLGRLNLSAATELGASILRLVERTENVQLRLELMAALPADTKLAESSLEQSVLQALNDDNVAVRQVALATAKRIRFGSASGTLLLAQLDRENPTGLPTVIQAISRLQDDAIDHAMLSALKEIPAARTLAMEQLVNLYRDRSNELQSAVRETTLALTRSPGDIEERVDTMLAKLPVGDALRGLQLFRGGRASCGACHRLGYVGGEIGPDLTRIGASRTRRALLEAIVFPSVRLEQSYQPTKILTVDGRVYNGLITKYLDPITLVMQLAADQTVIVKTDEIELQEPSSISIMPSALADLLTPQEIADLLAILEAAK